MLVFLQKLFAKMSFYAVAKGRTNGIFMTWADCEAQVKGFTGAKYKKFNSVVSAQEFITANGSIISGAANSKKKISNISTATNSEIKTSFSSSNSDNQSKSILNTHDKSKATQGSNETEDEVNGSLFEESDGLDEILSKQMDDIEKRLKTFEKGVDKIMKKGKRPILIDPPARKKSRLNNEYEQNSEGYVQVYTDGACSYNGKNGARAGIGVYWGDGHPLNVSEPVSGRATNNCGEIQAATRAIKQALENGVHKLTINTDSQFLINSVTKWMSGWKRKGWKLASGEPVKNQIDFKDLDSVRNKLDIKWNYVEAHRGIHGNEMADQLAKAGAALYTK